MAEAGVDISGHESKLITDLPEKIFDLVVTVCGHADENCPFFPLPAKRVHHGFDDPPKLAADATNEEDALVHLGGYEMSCNFVMNVPLKPT